MLLFVVLCDLPHSLLALLRNLAQGLLKNCLRELVASPVLLDGDASSQTGTRMAGYASPLLNLVPHFFLLDLNQSVASCGEITASLCEDEQQNGLLGFSTQSGFR